MKKFKIHFSFIVSFIIFVFSKYQIEYFCFLLCIFIHELGHLIALRIYNIKINCVTLYSFGFIMDSDKYKNISDEIIIYSAGIIFNLLFMILSKGILFEISFLLVIVNLLPIKVTGIKFIWPIKPATNLFLGLL